MKKSPANLSASNLPGAVRGPSAPAFATVFEASMPESKYTKSADEALMALVAGGDEDALVELMRRHKPRVFGMAWRVLGDLEEAAEVTQDVFFSVYKSAGRFAGRSRFTTWLYRIAVNAAMTSLRRRRRVETVESLDELEARGLGAELSGNANPAASGGPEDIEGRELAALFQRNLQLLPDAHRMVFILKETRGMSYRQIAKAMGIPEGGVRSRLHLARQRLREKMGRYLETGLHEETKP